MERGSDSMSKVVVIGGGASGLVSAIIACRNKHEVILLERNSICGKKILVTGNGRCNYFNTDQDVKHYHSMNEEIINQVITNKNLEKVLSFFESIGIIPKIKDGYYYPFSNQAVSIQNALIKEAKLLGVNIQNNMYVEDVWPCHNGYEVKTSEYIYEADCVIVATGSYAASKTGSDGNFYSLLERMGHSIIKPLPALVQLNAKGNFLKDWSGVRADVEIKLLEDNTTIREESGEILLTNYGISGICVMQLSGMVARGLDLEKREEVVINFIPSLAKSRVEFIHLMDERSKLLRGRNVSELLDSILNYKLVNTLIKNAGIAISKKWEQLSERDRSVLASQFVEFRLNIISTNSFSNAQVASGGIPLTEINPLTMESKIRKNLYLVGEVLDIYGDCGGYNLTFAWLSGLLAGTLGEKND